jgi:PB1 domain
METAGLVAPAKPSYATITLPNGSEVVLFDEPSADEWRRVTQSASVGLSAQDRSKIQENKKLKSAYEAALSAFHANQPAATSSLISFNRPLAASRGEMTALDVAWAVCTEADREFWLESDQDILEVAISSILEEEQMTPSATLQLDEAHWVSLALKLRHSMHELRKLVDDDFVEGEDDRSLHSIKSLQNFPSVVAAAPVMTAGQSAEGRDSRQQLEATEESDDGDFGVTPQTAIVESSPPPSPVLPNRPVDVQATLTGHGQQLFAITDRGNIGAAENSIFVAASSPVVHQPVKTRDPAQIGSVPSMNFVGSAASGSTVSVPAAVIAALRSKRNEANSVRLSEYFVPAHAIPDTKESTASITTFKTATSVGNGRLVPQLPAAGYNGGSTTAQVVPTSKASSGNKNKKVRGPLVGERVIKLQYLSEVRRIEIDGAISYASLARQTKDVLPDVRRAHKHIYFLWKDPEGDTITVSTDKELRDALYSLWGDEDGLIIRFKVTTIAPSDTTHPDDCASEDSDSDTSDDDVDDGESDALLVDLSCEKMFGVVAEESIMAGKDRMLTALGIRKFARSESKLGAFVSYIGVFITVAYVALFIYFLITNFYQLYEYQTFLSLDPSAGNCQGVGRIWTLPGLLLDTDGNWNGFPTFTQNKAIYAFNIFDFFNGNGAYVTLMTYFANQIKQLGATTSHYNLSINLLYWASWISFANTLGADGVTPETQSLTFTASAAYIMTGDLVSGTVANVAGDCPFGPGSTSYNAQSGILTLTYSYADFMAHPQCNHTINPVSAGYNPHITNDAFSLNLDVQTVFSSLTVALNVNGLDSISYYNSIDQVATGMYGNVMYQVLRYYDPNYSSMTPMYCISPLSTSNGAKGSSSSNSRISNYNCVIYLGGVTYGVPFFQHAGTNPLFAEKCDCTTESGHSLTCDQLDLMIGLITWDISKNQTAYKQYPTAFQPFIPIMEFFYGGASPKVAQDANDQAYFPGWAAIKGQGVSTYSASVWRKNAYQYFQTPSFGYGSLLVFNSFSFTDHTISQYKYQLTAGSCTDAFSSPALTSMVATPWGPLYEVYYKCTMHWQDALANGGGIAQGTSSIIVAIGSVVFLYMMLVGAKAHSMYLKAIRDDPLPVLGEGGQHGVELQHHRHHHSHHQHPHHGMGDHADHQHYLQAAQRAPGDDDDDDDDEDEIEAPKKKASKIQRSMQRLKAKLNRYEHLWGWEKPF